MREKLIWRLEDLESPLTSRKIIREVFERGEVYSGKYLEKAPDLILDQAPGIRISGEVEKDEIFERPTKWMADKKRIGLFLGYGPEIRSGERASCISILDIAPTTLHLYDLPIPSDMDGRVLKVVFKRSSDPVKRCVKRLKVKRGEKQVIKRRIESLRKSGKI